MKTTYTLVTKDNIMDFTVNFLQKARESMEKPKDEPRYKTVVQYEAEFKESYRDGLKTMFKGVLKQYKKFLNNDSTTSTNTRTS